MNKTPDREAGPGEPGAPEASGLLHSKNHFCGVKMHIIFIDVNFCLNYVRTHNTVSNAEVVQSTEAA